MVFFYLGEGKGESSASNAGADDDYIGAGAVNWGEFSVVRAVDAFILNDRRITLVLLSIALGMAGIPATENRESEKT